MELSSVQLSVEIPIHTEDSFIIECRFDTNNNDTDKNIFQIPFSEENSRLIADIRAKINLNNNNNNIYLKFMTNQPRLNRLRWLSWEELFNEKSLLVRNSRDVITGKSCIKFRFYNENLNFNQQKQDMQFLEVGIKSSNLEVYFKNESNTYSCISDVIKELSLKKDLCLFWLKLQKYDKESDRQYVLNQIWREFISLELPALVILDHEETENIKLFNGSITNTLSRITPRPMLFIRDQMVELVNIKEDIEHSLGGNESIGLKITDIVLKEKGELPENFYGLFPKLKNGILIENSQLFLLSGEEKLSDRVVFVDTRYKKIFHAPIGSRKYSKINIDNSVSILIDNLINKEDLVGLDYDEWYTPELYLRQSIISDIDIQKNIEWIKLDAEFSSKKEIKIEEIMNNINGNLLVIGDYAVCSYEFTHRLCRYLYNNHQAIPIYCNLSTLYGSYDNWPYDWLLDIGNINSKIVDNLLKQRIYFIFEGCSQIKPERCDEICERIKKLQEKESFNVIFVLDEDNDVIANQFNIHFKIVLNKPRLQSILQEQEDTDFLDDIIHDYCKKELKNGKLFDLVAHIYQCEPISGTDIVMLKIQPKGWLVISSLMVGILFFLFTWILLSLFKIHAIETSYLIIIIDSIIIVLVSFLRIKYTHKFPFANGLRFRRLGIQSNTILTTLESLIVVLFGIIIGVVIGIVNGTIVNNNDLLNNWPDILLLAAMGFMIGVATSGVVLVHKL
ncbi:hypothetical protein [Candidatus Oscillochloris fontis]|uniref:hypothetical protein n=1 Tax=Candidatus Oscillochloris fontis TaxID=2496868 RepID=UPI00101DDB6E|nr:hypothetical protein [Candidatus Oscillochloris fontis]